MQKHFIIDVWQGPKYVSALDNYFKKCKVNLHVTLTVNIIFFSQIDILKMSLAKKNKNIFLKIYDIIHKNFQCQYYSQTFKRLHEPSGQVLC